ncbi:DoxX family protein [Nocardia wallacei]|uniref:DoxX family protein n=1 Tax=Nocardia wallacei TaxID=480035 RepID=UPI002458FFEF|nr:DoxX family protein [Nocardia wallacei]
MSVDVIAEPAQQDSATPRMVYWPVAVRVLFRFFFSYIVLFYVATALVITSLAGWAGRFIPEAVLTAPGRALDPLVRWVGTHVFGTTIAPETVTGSGDTAATWVLAACLLAIAAVITLIWSILDRRRPAYPSLHTGLRLMIRFGLAATMFVYGFAKVFPTQMTLGLFRYVERFGDMSPMGVLWSQVGASPQYEIALGSAEVLAGVLLILPWTATAGALLALVDMAQVLLLNLTFDVPVKLFAFHLLLQSAVLLAPEARRLTRALLGRAAPAATPPARWSTTRTAVIVQVALGAWVLGGAVQQGWANWHDSQRLSPLHGIWEVTEFTAAGQLRPPLTTDAERPRHIVFDRVFDRPTGPSTDTVIQGMDDRISRMSAIIDTGRNRMELAQGAGKPYGALTFERPGPDRMVLEGTLRDQPVRIVAHRIDETAFTLPSRGFHWVQEFPYNR